MKLPFKAAAAFIASPQGRRAIKRAREKFDTPENRKRAGSALTAARARVAARVGANKAPDPRRSSGSSG